MRLLTLLILTIALPLGMAAQFETDYTPLQCAGEIPSDVTQEAREKLVEDVNREIEKSDSKKERELKKEFLLNSTYRLDGLLTSGQVLYGDPVSGYVNQVADKVLYDYPDLRDELRFYCLRSSVTNAFATSQGMIFVTLGLISQLENEAQLAFVLAHEIAHYEQDHVIDSYLETQKIKKNNKYRSYDDNIRALSSYSKAQEMEADSLGYYRIGETKYDLDACLSTFNVLQFSHLPFDLYEFTPSFMETENFVIPTDLILEEPVEIDFDDDDDDSYSTHPNIKKRRTQVMGLSDSQIRNISKNNQSFVVSEDTFNQVREIARFETVKMNLNNRNYVTCIYNAQSMLEKYPNNKFLKVAQAKAFYGLAKYKNEDYSDLYADYDEYQGYISIPYYMFEKMSREELNTTAIKVVSDVMAQYPEDKILEDQFRDLVYDLVSRHKLYYIDFENYEEAYRMKNDSLAQAISDSTFVEVEEEEQKELSKYDKLNSLKKEGEEDDVEERLDDNAFHLLAFADHPNDEVIKATFLEMQDYWEEESEEEEEELTRSEVRANRRRESRHLKDDGVQADKLLIIDPVFLIFDENLNNDIQKSEEKTNQLKQHIRDVEEVVNLEIEILDPKELADDEGDYYNKLAAFNSWLSEMQNHEDYDDDWTFINSQNEELKSLMEEYNTDYFAYTVVIKYWQPSNIYGNLIYMGLLVPQFYPIIVDMYRKKKQSAFITYVYNASRGDVAVSYEYNSRNNLDNNMLRAYIYEMFTNLQK